MMKKVLLLTMVFLFLTSPLLASTVPSGLENIIINDSSIIKSEVQNDEVSLKNALVEEGLGDYSVSLINKEDIPEGIEPMVFDSDEAAAAYIERDEAKQVLTAIRETNFPPTPKGVENGIKPMAYQIYSVAFETTGWSTAYLNAGGNNTYYQGSRYFTSIGNPYVTHNGFSLGISYATNSSWSSIHSSKRAATLSAHITKNRYIVIQGIGKVTSSSYTVSRVVYA